MTRLTGFFVATVFAVAFVCGGIAHAQGTAMTQTAGAYKVELHVLPPEPFHTKAEVDAGKATMGMLIVSGAEAVQPGSAAHPNHHLIVHVFDTATGKPVTDADVSMTYQSVGADGKPAGTLHHVPVVNMQVIGKGAASTHYGNNVSMPSGTCHVVVTVNGQTAEFTLSV